MRDGVEIFGASAAVTVLAFFLVPAPAPDGRDGSGAEGAALVSVAAATAQVEALVDAWTTPPEMATLPEAPPQPTPMPPTQTPPVPPRSTDSSAAPPIAAPALVPMPVAAPPDTAAPPPPVADRAPAAPLAPMRAPKPPSRPARDIAATTPAPVPATTPAPDRAQQTAAGTGQGAQRGSASAPRQSATASASQRASLLSRWGGKIQARIARRAPRGAGAGTAIVTLTVSGTGALVSVGLSQSSGNPAIDRLALRAVQGAGGFPAAPPRLGPGPFTFSVPIRSR